MDSLYNILIDTFNRSAEAICALYTAISDDIRQKADRAVLGSDDEHSAARLAGNHIETFLDENRRYLANSYQGLAVIQTAYQNTSDILEKLQTMKQLAQNAADGLYDRDQMQNARQQFEILIAEIDAIAVQTQPGGFFMLAATAFGAVGIQVDRDQKIEIDSMDMTAAGLGLIQDMDLAGDPADVLVSLQIAVEEVSAYRQHLAESRVAVEDSIDVLNNEREAILPALIAVRESRSAWNAVQALAALLEETGALSVAVQARIESDRVIRLLMDHKK
jgi:hypothetical protein